MGGQLLPQPAVLLLQVVEVSAHLLGIPLESRLAKALDRGARLGGAERS